MKVIKLDLSHTPIIEKFCEEAKAAGYQNNSSIKKMKFGDKYDLQEIPKFWGILNENNELISVSGSHCWKTNNLTENKIVTRCLFRSATLPKYSNIIQSLNKYHMNSLPFSVLLPLQINNGLKEGSKNFYITTSKNEQDDASGKMKRTHKVLELLEKRKIVNHVEDLMLYGVFQSKWEINLDNYLSALRSFHNSRIQHGISIDEEYCSIINNGFYK